MLTSYCRRLMLPLTYKSVEPLAADLDPLSCHLVASTFQDHFCGAVALVGRCGEAWVTALTGCCRGWTFRSGHGILDPLDDTGISKRGTHSVGVAKAVLRAIGETDACRVAVSLSIATATARSADRVPTLPAGIVGRGRAARKNAGVPEDVRLPQAGDFAGLEEYPESRRTTGVTHCAGGRRVWGRYPLPRYGITGLQECTTPWGSRRAPRSGRRAARYRPSRGQ
ncbi:MAG: transposase [Sulfuritalea sp.]|nr:transposase [Sulfuritalea sp.]